MDVNGGIKVSNSGEIKLSTCQSLELKPRGHVDDYKGSVEGHESPDLQVGDEVNPSLFFSAI